MPRRTHSRSSRKPAKREKKKGKKYMEVCNFKEQTLLTNPIDDWGDAVSRAPVPRSAPTYISVPRRCDYCTDDAEWRSADYSTEVCGGCRMWFGAHWEHDAEWTYIGSDRRDKNDNSFSYTVKEPESVDAIMARHQALFEERRQQAQVAALEPFVRSEQEDGEFVNIAAPNGEIVQIRLDVQDSYAWRVS